MIISERIFELLEKRGMSQKEFSEKTGIAQSAISDWKRKKTNPVSEKILIICETLEVTPEELLSGVDHSDGRSRKSDYYIIGKDTELGTLIEQYRSLSPEMRGRIEGYMEALKAMEGH
ncbi:MAG: helix-turn-helix domain-containing protein [Lachnospiraceae bacterium]|nr:helix-turn-helix domain-containing protein [Lachnospiraceae bacterium]